MDDKILQYLSNYDTSCFSLLTQSIEESAKKSNDEKLIMISCLASSTLL